MKEILMNSIITIISAMLVGTLTYVCRFLSSKVAIQKQKAISEKNEALTSTFNAVENILSAVTSTVVGKIEQTTAGELREMVKAGTANREELTILAKDAYYEILDMLKPDVLEQLKTVSDDWEKYIKDKIEDAVRKVKIEAASTTVDEDIDMLFHEKEIEVNGK